MFAAAYTVTDLAPDTNGIAHTGKAIGISDNGAYIAGQYDGHAAIWHNGVLQDLGFNGYAADVNNNGVAVGQDTTSGGDAFVWKAGVETKLSLNGSTSGVIYAVNNSGTVAGTINSSGSAHGVYAALGGAAHDIGAPAGFTSVIASGINDKGQIIGDVSGNTGNRGFIYSGNAFKILGPLPGGPSTRVSHGLASDGTVAVSGASADIYSDGSTKIYHAYTIGSNGYGAPVDKGTFGNFYDTDAADISANGKIIVGNNDPGLFDGQGMVNTGNGFKLLDNEIDQSLGLRLRYAGGVTDAGKIVAYGFDKDGQTNPYVLTPVAVNNAYSINGRLWNDTNNNGKQDGAEVASGVRTVYIDANSNNKLDAGEKQTQSDANGNYTLSGLANGTYKVTRVFPSGYHLSNGVNGAQYVTITVNGTSWLGVNLGSAQGAVVPPSQGSISGVVFNDNDRDGFFDANEQTSGVRTVFIDTNANGKLDAGEKSTQSDAKGHYSFNGLSAGTYRVTRVFPSGYTMYPKNALTINLASGQSALNVNLGSSSIV